MPPSQAIFDAALTFEQPIQRLIGLPFLDPAKVQDRAQTRYRRLLIDRADKAQLRSWRNQSLNPHGDNEIAAASRGRILRRTQDQPVEADFADHSKRRRNMAVRQGALDFQFLRTGADDRSAFQHRLQCIDHIARQLAEIGQRPLLRTAFLVAITLPQQHRRRRVSIGHRLDEHARIESYPRRFGNPLTWTQSQDHSHPNPLHRLNSRLTTRANFGLMKPVPNVATEMALTVLAYTLTRVMNIVGIKPLL